MTRMIPAETDEAIDAESYPISSEELVARYGDHLLEFQDGTERIEEVVGRQSDAVYESPLEVRMAVLNGVSAGAVGRRFYSDRDPTPPGATLGHDQLSF